MNKITQDVCKWQEEAFTQQKNEFDKRSNSRTFSAGYIVYVVRPHSGHLAQKFQPKFEGPFFCDKSKIPQQLPSARLH
jgi:hypothetical protein